VRRKSGEKTNAARAEVAKRWGERQEAKDD
jgi:hypothetical protein